MTDQATGASERHEDRDAVGSPVQRPVRPCAWKCSTCANTSDCEGATTGDNWCNSCGACETMRPLYDQAALDAAVAAERERLRHALILRSQETYGVLMQEHAEAAAWIAEA